MSKLYADINGRSVPFFRPGATQAIAVAGASAPVALAFAAATRVLRVVSSTAAFIATAVAPVATVNDPIVPAGRVTYVVLAGSGLKLAALQVSAGGTMTVTEMAG